MDLGVGVFKLLYSLLSFLLIPVIWYSGADRITRFLAVGVVGWSGLVYLNFQFNLFSLTGTYFLDWIVSTPLLVAGFLYESGASLRRVVGTALLQVGVVLYGFSALVFPEFFTAFFVFSSLLMVSVLISLGEFFGENRLAYVLIASTFLGYPLLFWVSEGVLTEVALWLVVLPLVSKHVVALVEVYPVEEYFFE